MVKKAAQAHPNHLLRRARQERGWSQRVVADRIGAPQDTMITRWERGNAIPSPYYIERLCQLFGMTATELGLLSQEPAGKSEQTVPVPGKPSPLSPAPAEDTAPFWNVPFRRNPFFTGRSGLLERLHGQLAQTHRAALTQSTALTGLGGVGKTQTAVEYAYRYRQEYRAVFWVRAASQETLTADMVALAQLLRLPGRESQDQMHIVAAVKRWLAREQGWLLILDNADDLTLVEDMLPAGAGGHIIVTTRAQSTGALGEILAVEKLDQAEGILLLLRRAKLLAPDAPLDNASRQLYTQARAIVQALDGFPLALDQAGAYLEETGCSLADYLTLYERHRQFFLSRPGAESADYPDTVASTWVLSFGQVEQANPAAADLLRLCAFLQPDAIAEEIITAGAAQLGPVLGPVAADLLQLNEALRVLRRYSLVRRDPEARALSLHRLVQAVLRDRLDTAAERQWAERAVLALNAAFPGIDHTVWDRCERLLPHAQVAAALIEQHGLVLPEAVHLLHQAGSYLSARELHMQAEPFLQQALHIAEAAWGARHLETANLLFDLATAIHYQGKFEQTEPLLLRSLVIREELLGTQHAEVAESLRELGGLYLDMGKYEQVEPFYLRALAIWENPSGTGRVELAQGLSNALNDLATLYWILGRFEQAESLFLRALRIREDRLGPDHPDTASSLNDLAVLYREQGKYKQAERLLHRAVRIQEQALGSEHPLLASSLGNLAQVLTFQDKYAEAEPLHLRALRMREEIYGPEYLDTTFSMINLGVFYQRQGKYEQAEPLFLRALQMREQGLGPAHPNVARSLTHLAQFYRASGQPERAEPLLTRALPIFEQALGPDHRETIRAHESYTQLLQTLQRAPGKARPETGD
jgi:tetratricopeptide (TPR) repeat protein/transcriptional regulator with XRE-family HTH domain